MCRAHRLTIAFTAALWALTFVIAFVVQPADGSPWKTVMIMVGTLSVVLVPYSLFPYLLRGVLQEELKDLAGAFLLGWKEAKEDPKNPKAAPLRSVS